MFAFYMWGNAAVNGNAQQLAPRLHLWALVILCLACATAAVLLDRVTAGWSYAVAPTLAAVVAGGLELRRSDRTIVGSAIAVFVDTGLLMILGLFVKFFLLLSTGGNGGD